MAASVAQTPVSAYAATSPLTTSAFGAAPSSGDVTVTVVDSDTTMTSGPSGATLRASDVSTAGVYLYDDTSTSTTRTVTPNGANQTAVAAVDITGTSGFDAVSAVAKTIATAGQASRTVTGFTTGAGAGTLVLAVVTVANITITMPTTPTWNNSFTHLFTVGTGATGAASFLIYVAQRFVPAGTAIGTTTCSWSGTSSNTTAYHIGYLSSGAAAGSPAPPPQVVTRITRFRSSLY